MFFSNDGIGARRRRLLGVNGVQLKREREKSGRGKSDAPGTASLRLEQLEDRALLSVATAAVSVAEFEAIRDAYSALDLPPSAAEINVIEIKASDLSYELATRAIEQAAATPEDDLIVLRTSDSEYQLDLGDANFSVNIDSNVSGSVSLVSFGTRALQIATTSSEGVFNVSSGSVGLGGFALIGFSSVGAIDLISVAPDASLVSDSLTLLTRTNTNVGGFSIGANDEVQSKILGDQVNQESAPFTLIGSNDYYASRGTTNEKVSPSQESWSVDFQCGETERAFLAGLSTEDAILITSGSGSFQTSVFFDADKSGWGYDDDGDDQFCWVGAASNMLYYTGWAPQSVFPDEQAVFDVFTGNHTDSPGNAYYGIGWFIEGNKNDYFHTLLDSTTENAGFYASQLASFNESCANYVGLTDLYDNVAGMNRLANLIRSNYGIGLSLDWTNEANGRAVSSGEGHALTCWGYVYNDSLQNSNPNYYKSLFVTDSDDYQSEARKLQNYEISWSPKSENGYMTGYIFTTYHRKSQFSFGFLHSFQSLAPKPTKYSFRGETRSTVVTTASDVFDPSDGMISLREAISYAGTGNLGTTITFASSLKGKTIKLAGKQLKIDKSITIDATSLWTAAGGTPGVTIDAGGKSRAFYIDGNAEIKGVKITNGRTDRGGAGIYAKNCNLTIDKCVISGNNAPNGEGGGICAENCLITITNGKVLNNAAKDGGGICVKSNGNLTITNSVVSGNNASNGEGGGICAQDGVAATISNVEVSNNAAKYGGGIVSWGASIKITNGTISGNVASSTGGGFCCSGGTCEFYNSILAINSGGDLSSSGSPTIIARASLSSVAAWATAPSNYVYNSSKPLFANASCGDYRLVENSQAIDKGDNAYATSAFDLTGYPRVIDGIVDLGAYEFQNGAVYPDDLEPNDSLATAFNLGALSGVNRYVATIHVGSDKDYYKFSIGEGCAANHYV